MLVDLWPLCAQVSCLIGHAHLDFFGGTEWHLLLELELNWVLFGVPNFQDVHKGVQVVLDQSTSVAVGDGDGVTRDPNGLVCSQRESEVLVRRCVT